LERKTNFHKDSNYCRFILPSVLVYYLGGRVDDRGEGRKLFGRGRGEGIIIKSSKFNICYET
jgi:hypothetical protein